jgi:hypothetical protein
VSRLAALQARAQLPIPASSAGAAAPFPALRPARTYPDRRDDVGLLWPRAICWS